MASLMTEAKPLFYGGVAGGAAGFVYDRYIGAQVRSFIGNFAGGWTDAVGSFGVGLLIKKFSKGKQWGHDAAVGLFSHELALALETQVPALGGGGGAPAAGAASRQNPLASYAIVR